MPLDEICLHQEYRIYYATAAKPVKKWQWNTVFRIANFNKASKDENSEYVVTLAVYMSWYKLSERVYRYFSASQTKEKEKPDRIVRWSLPGFVFKWQCFLLVKRYLIQTKKNRNKKTISGQETIIYHNKDTLFIKSGRNPHRLLNRQYYLLFNIKIWLCR